MPCSVSVVTPSYNHARYIERTIQSVLSQGIPGLEYLVFDGGSTDNTVDILRRYEPQLRWVSEKDRGQADAVNKGYEAARGDVIGWMNSDDIYYPGAIAAVRECFDANPTIDVVYGDSNHIDEDDNVLEPYPTEDFDYNRLLDVCFICQPSVFIRRHVVEKCGLLNLKRYYCLDYDYWIRLAQHGMRFQRVRYLVAGSRMYKANKTLAAPTKCHLEYNTMFKDLLGQVPDRWLFNYAHAVLDEKGVPRSDAFRFPLLVSVESIRAAWRWNGRVSPEMFKTTREWVKAAAQGAFGGLLAK